MSIILLFLEKFAFLVLNVYAAATACKGFGDDGDTAAEHDEIKRIYAESIIESVIESMDARRVGPENDASNQGKSNGNTG